MKKVTNKKATQRVRRHSRIRAKVVGTKEIPRLAVYRSNKYIYAQLIDDAAGATVATASDISEKGKKTKTEKAKMVGVVLAKAAKNKKISTVVFDRGGFIFTGRVKALAEGAREGGLKF
ncbi:MAG: 50S ribosomal protein L18 [Candidatus Pacebacteria bacterium]|nr:50S ribosomal protein L18 [Candidatus Paceibacterota bacterium]